MRTGIRPSAGGTLGGEIMISVSDFRNGVTFDMDGKVMQIVEFQHVKPGKGAAFVRVIH